MNYIRSGNFIYFINRVNYDEFTSFFTTLLSQLNIENPELEISLVDFEELIISVLQQFDKSEKSKYISIGKGFGHLHFGGSFGDFRIQISLTTYPHIEFGIIRKIDERFSDISQSRIGEIINNEVAHIFRDYCIDKKKGINFLLFSQKQIISREFGMYGYLYSYYKLKANRKKLKAFKHGKYENHSNNSIVDLHNLSKKLNELTQSKTVWVNNKLDNNSISSETLIIECENLLINK